MTDSNDVARETNRAAMVAAAAKHLGPGREKSCQLLGDIMMASIETIAAAAGVKIQLTSDSPDVQQLIDKLGPQIQKHAEQIAHAAIHVLADVYLKTLIVATRAQDLEAEELAKLH
jgi:urease accessory protein UreF